MFLKVLAFIPGLVRLYDISKEAYRAIRRYLQKRRDDRNKDAVKAVENAQTKQEIKDAIDKLSRDP